MLTPQYHKQRCLANHWVSCWLSACAAVVVWFGLVDQAPAGVILTMSSVSMSEADVDELVASEEMKPSQSPPVIPSEKVDLGPDSDQQALATSASQGTSSAGPSGSGSPAPTTTALLSMTCELSPPAPAARFVGERGLHIPLPPPSDLLRPPRS